MKRVRHQTVKKGATSLQSRSKRTVQNTFSVELLERLHEGVVIYNPTGSISSLNLVAAYLFNKPSVATCIGANSVDFFTQARIWDESYVKLSPEQLCELFGLLETPVDIVRERHLFFQEPHGLMVEMELYCAPLYTALYSHVERVCVLHNVTERSQQEHYLENVSMSLLGLAKDLPRLPEKAGLPFPEEPLLLPPELNFVTQQLVDMLRQSLQCTGPTLFSISPHDGSLTLVASANLDPEKQRRALNHQRYYHITDFIPDELITLLKEGKEIILARDQMLTIEGPFHADVRQSADFKEDLLIVPLFLDGKLAGGIMFGKEKSGCTYTPNEIIYIRAITEMSALVIECVRSLYEWSETQAHTVLLEQTNQRMNTFLTLASHELKTPLTTIMGNLQLLRNRLQRAENASDDLPYKLKEALHNLGEPLEAAYESGCVQRSMINDMIDDALIQTDTLTLRMVPCDLVTVVKNTLAALPPQDTSRFVIDNRLQEQDIVPVLGDIERIKQVLMVYIANALSYTPRNELIYIMIEQEQKRVRVSVMNSGPGISPDEQEHVWERFYRPKGIGVQHELDLSLGLQLYLCKELIQRQHGNVGLTSIPGESTTFWFELPVLAPSGS